MNNIEGGNDEVRDEDAFVVEQMLLFYTQAPGHYQRR